MTPVRKAALALFVLSVPLLIGGQALTADSVEDKAAILEIDGPIGPATTDYFERSLNEAVEGGARVVILRMDTPGGLSDAMRDIIKEILASPVPVATYVAPSGARAASAGTYMLYASHVAAMAPGTNLGAATPVQISPGGGSPTPLPEGEGDKPDKKGAPGDDPDGPKQDDEKQEPAGPGGDAMSHKMVNDAVAYIRSLATMRGRNADWAEKAVREAASLPAEEALEKNVIDLMAVSVTELLQKMDGRTVQLADGEHKLETADLAVVEIQPDWRNELLAILTNPNVAYVLMLLGIYGLIFEFSNPGSVVPGVAGAICLLLALFAFQALPINYAGLGLIILGLMLMVGEAVAPSFGALGIGGAVAFIIGSVILMDTDAPGFGISLALIGAVALFTALLLITLLGVLIRTRRQPVRTGAQGLIGAPGEALDSFSGRGSVRVQGEVWSAEASEPVEQGQRVRVTDREGLLLKVEAAENR